ncbi:MAG: N-acetyltransferase [Terracidiphilus sp.]|jgi:ribosomal-protein-alanine N-acetyltransferase
MNYRPYTAEDFDKLYALEEVCFQPPFRFSRRTMRALVQRPHAATWIAEEGGQMAGFAIVEWTERRGESTAYIQTVEIAPEARRRGVGRELMGRIEESMRSSGADSIWLHVEAENADAIRLYESQGYDCQGRQERFYPLGQPALIYVKRLDSTSASSPLPSARRGVEIRVRAPKSS